MHCDGNVKAYEPACQKTMIEEGARWLMNLENVKPAHRVYPIPLENVKRLEIFFVSIVDINF